MNEEDAFRGKSIRRGQEECLLGVHPRTSYTPGTEAVPRPGCPRSFLVPWRGSCKLLPQMDDQQEPGLMFKPILPIKMT